MKRIRILILILFSCFVAHAQDQQKAQLAKQNHVLDKAEARIRAKFGPAIVSINRNFRNASLVVDVDEEIMSKIVSTQASGFHIIPRANAQAIPKAPTPPPSPTLGPTSGQAPPPVPSAFDRAKQTIERGIRDIPVTPTFESRPGGGVIGVRIGPGVSLPPTPTPPPRAR